LSDVTFNQPLRSLVIVIYGLVSFGCHGQRVNKLNNARRIFEQLSPWLCRCWHPTTPTTARRPRSICFP